MYAARPCTRKCCALYVLALLVLVGSLGLGAASATDSTGRLKAAAILSQAVEALPPAAQFAQAAAAPANVTGTYKGVWRKQEVPGPSQVRLLQHGEGLVIFQLKTSPSSTQGVHEVAGELVLRDGVYVTEDDVALHLAGVFVPSIGRLHAVATPVQPLHAHLQADEAAAGTEEYRAALREVAQQASGAAGELPAALLGRQQALPLRKSCTFTLDLSVHLLPATQVEGQDDDSQAEAAPGDQEMALLTGSGDAVMNGTLRADNCGLVLSLNATTTHIEAYYAKAINYTLMITALSFLQILLLIRQMEATSTQASSSKVSLLTIGHQSIMDAYLCLLHLTTGIMVEPLFNAFATAAFFQFVIFAIFEMRYLLSIWRARRGSSLDAWAAQRELSMLYARFYGCLLAGIFLSYQLQRWLRYLVFGLYSWWVPQIVLCAREDVRQPLQPAYVVGVSAARLALPLYLAACPHNLLRLQPWPRLALALTAWLAVQAGVLLLQTRWGPRWFIPKRFLPPKYDYFRPLTPRQVTPGGGDGSAPGDVETGEGSVECVICMNPVQVETASARMVTPCAHFFHAQCLQRWMEVKMECPTCRRPLPLP